ncbi:MAG: NAD-dependent epimerase/dehydratase family protein [Pseudomonadota bacterium]|nr:NAD-dependent epimerase/dehydratase family protein [Pseudomonadota bacterium]
MQNCLVTGCAGFIGSHITDFLLNRKFNVIGIDNLSTGREKFLEHNLENRRFTFVNEDLLNYNKICKYFKDISIVYHLSANADVRFGFDHPKKDIDQNILVTSNVLEAMKHSDVKKIIFSSTGSVYGEHKIIPTPEDVGFPIQTSLYATSKIACEGLITSYCNAYDMQSWIFRFVSIVGERYQHGHIYDFFKQLQNNPNQLHILGDGHQRKSYLYINDCLDAIDLSLNFFNEKNNIINLGYDGYCEVNDSAKWITEYLNLHPKLTYSGQKRGWVGDNPFIHLDVTKISKTGWKPECSIEDGVKKTVKYLSDNKWLFK